MTYPQILENLYVKLSTEAIKRTDEPSTWTWYHYANILYLLWHSSTKEEADIMKILIKTDVSVEAYLKACPEVLEPIDANLFIDVSEVFFELENDLQMILLKSTAFWRAYLNHSEAYQEKVREYVKYIGFIHELGLIEVVGAFITFDESEKLLLLDEEGVDLLFYLIEELNHDNVEVLTEELFPLFINAVSPLEINRICAELPEDSLRIARLIKYKEAVIRNMFAKQSTTEQSNVFYLKRKAY